MASDGTTAIVTLAAGAGGGLLLWYLLRDRAPASTTAPASAATTTGAAPATSTTPTSAAPVVHTPGACAIVLDASGITADGAHVDIPGAVSKCKSAGKADLTYATSAPGNVFVDLNKALAAAGIAVTVWAP